MDNAKNGLETERKFLVKIPDLLSEKQSGEMHIIQTYLKRNDPDIQRRVRKITADGKSIFVYTEKKRLSDLTREEKEYSVSEEEYERLYSEKDNSLAEVDKTRHFIDHKGQHFEMDIYPFSQKLATIELELSDESQEIEFPPFVEIIKEVTGDPDYFNAELAGKKKFPGE